MKTYLVTASLCGAVDWYKNCPPTWKDKAEKDLYNTIHRIWTGGSPEMLAGIAFEKAVYRATTDTTRGAGSAMFWDVVDRCRGGQFQVAEKVIREIAIPGAGVLPVCLYAKYDVKFPDRILDIKTTGRYKQGKYLGTSQHGIYCYVSGIREFEYIVAEWKDEPGQEIGAVHTEKWTADPAELEGQVFRWTQETVGFIRSRSDLWEGYERIFSK